MRILKSLLWLGILSLGSLSAEIIEIQSMTEILPYVEPEALLVLDIDETLLTTEQMAGGDRWFEHSIKTWQDQGFSHEEAIVKTFPTYLNLQSATAVRSIECCTPAIIHWIQKQGITVIGLTSRNTGLAYATIRQLHSLEINLSKSPIKIDPLDISAHPPLFYFEGILFTQDLNKGEILGNLAKYAKYELKKVLFVDDKLKYVEQVGEYCEARGIPYIGFRYGGSDDSLRMYDHGVASIQEEHLGKLLSNELAEQILKDRGKASS